MNDTIRAALVNVIKANRIRMSRAQRQKGVKPQRWLYPHATEARYAAMIRTWLRPIKEYVHNYLKENHEAILHGDSIDFRTDTADNVSVTRIDAVPGKSFKVMIDSLNGWLGQYVPEDNENVSGSPIYMGLGQISESVFKFNDGQFQKSAKSVLGVEFPSGEEWWPGARDTWANNNYQLIRSDMKNYISQINNLTERAVTTGTSIKTLRQQIMALDDKITKSRANFLARDQIGKLNGQITQARMEDAGLTMYIWETCGDERVRGEPAGKYPNARPSHYLMDGKLCRWDDSTVYSQDGGKTWIDRPYDAVMLHPEMDYQCRCSALAYWQELVGEADAVIDKIEGVDDISVAPQTQTKSKAIGKATNNQKINKPPMSKEQEEKKLKSILGIDKVKTTGIPAEVLKEINNELAKILNEYPQLQGVIQQVKVSTAKDAGTAAFSVKYKGGKIITTLILSSDDLKSLDNIVKIIEKEVAIRNWTPKDGVGGIIRHEMAHALEFIQTFIEKGVDFTSVDVNGMVDRHFAFEAFGDHEVADRVVHQALKNLGMRYGEWVDLCEYAYKGGIGEAFAEAMSDASEQELSKEIVKLTGRGFK
jgi:hypothetical protein